jgi:hypothetical protein
VEAKVLDAMRQVLDEAEAAGGANTPPHGRDR